MEGLKRETHSSDQKNFFLSTALDFAQWHYLFFGYLSPWPALMILGTQDFKIAWSSSLK